MTFNGLINHIVLIMIMLHLNRNYGLILNRRYFPVHQQLKFRCHNVAESKLQNDSFTTNSIKSSEFPPSDQLYPNFSFQIKFQSSNSKARTAVISTPHGTIQTPNFVFCATKASMKAVTCTQMREENTQIILSNTYHLMVTPGSELIEKMGGLQKFTAWNGPMLTDSGGYQIFSMGFGSVSNEIKGNRDTEALGWKQSLIKIDEEGATFRSYLDGTIHELTPEKSIKIQRQLGADLIVVLDECTPFNVDKQYTEDSMHRSHRWALRSLEEFIRTSTDPKYQGKQALYGIIQGGVYNDLRDKSTEFVNSNPFFGTAIGGSLGATKQHMHDIVAYTRSVVRDDRPVHLLGIGGVRDIFHGVRQGIDTFDCVHPTRVGRHGGALVRAKFWEEESGPYEDDAISNTSMSRVFEIRAEKLRMKAIQRANTWKKMKGGAEFDPIPSTDPIVEAIPIRKKKPNPPVVVREHMNLDKSKMRCDPRPIDPTCQCYTCRNFSRSYLHHLFKARESLGGSLVSIHNVHFMNQLMKDIREGIENGNLDEVERLYVHPALLLPSSPLSSPSPTPQSENAELRS